MMTPERIKELRGLADKKDYVKMMFVFECLDEIERLRAERNKWVNNYVGVLVDYICMPENSWLFEELRPQMTKLVGLCCGKQNKG